MNKKQKLRLLRIIIASIALIVLHFIDLPRFERLGAYGTVYLLIGGDILIKAFKKIGKGQVFNENFLMSVATAGAIVLAWNKTGDYTEAVAVMLFFQTGELFESYAVGKSRKNIKELMDIRPDYATIEQNGELEHVDPRTVETGSVITVLCGEKIPLDGIVIQGESSLNTAALTGESVPRSVKAGDEVLSGSINLESMLRIRTTGEFETSTASKILELVENAGTHKSKAEKFISKFARIYTPAVCFSAFLLALLPPLFRTFVSDLPPDWENWLYRALIFLVVSCPCALVISIPLSFFAAVGRAGREGILIKGGNYLEALSKTETVVFDKTGTLTRGVFEVCAVHHNKTDETELLKYAALAESLSAHPIAKSIRCAYGKETDPTRVSNIRETAGEGITARADGMEIALGNDKLMKRLNIDCKSCHETGTIVHIAINGRYEGHIVIADIIKPQAGETVATLKNIGVTETVMLTGDSPAVSIKTGKLLGIDDIFSDLLPTGKVEKIKELLKNKPAKTTLAFVGDGLNDAPVLSLADIGIAMGGVGTDAAIEAADIVLMDDNPMKIVTAIRLARKCLRIVRENILFAIGVKLLCLILGTLGLAGMGLAIFADVGVMILAVFNTVRILYTPLT